MSKNRDSVVTHKKCAKYVANSAVSLANQSTGKSTPVPCRNCGQPEKKH